ncbi:malonate decarboxylase acyl carrier protein [Acinetobacter tibetensis]|uniref:Malonate decarboxylase acyl carrier protein n=1 Tax=Acinetobacter tibetensis TaxID=2943497 RepID=A0AAE9S158_9GAMM|nr:malonate decarboxylase acyl carrier protein [Acinetobacter tibetensis]USE84517.1 malonate decarboxylase acyl carrier protein [Acinetobacter tibetensis]
MEKLKFELQSAPLSAEQAAVICGVVGSGNLEVLVSQHDQADICQIEVTTSAVGFQHVWQSVLNEFAQRHAVAGLKFQLNDMGATPAVVNLRLSQALSMFKGV